MTATATSKRSRAINQIKRNQIKGDLPAHTHNRPHMKCVCCAVAEVRVSESSICVSVSRGIARARAKAEQKSDGAEGDGGRGVKQKRSYDKAFLSHLID